MPDDAPKRLQEVFRKVVAWRRAIAVLYAVLLPAGILMALRVPTDSGIDRLITESAPEYVATRAFQKVFPDPQSTLLLLEAEDPFNPEVLRQARSLEASLASVPRVHPYSLLTIQQLLKPAAGGSIDAAALRRFALGTDMFHRQGLFGEHFLGIALTPTFDGAAQRDEMIAAIERILDAVPKSKHGIRAIRRVGRAYVENYLERETARSTLTYFPLFGLLLVAVTLALYRSPRALLAILLTLGTSVALGVGFAAIAGFAFTIVSALVPLTILVTCMATLVYLHSRFVDRPEGISIDDHQIFALANKFVPVTASLVAAALGFAALGVSRIRPIRDLGLWLSAALAITWVVCFTLFPALQKLLATPTRTRRADGVALLEGVVQALPRVTYRWRWWLVPGALFLALGGAAALFGIPGYLSPMRMQVSPLDYVDPATPIYRDMTYFEKEIGGLSLVHVWVKTGSGSVLAPEFLRGLARYAHDLEADPRVSFVAGLPTVLRLRQYATGQGDTLPDDLGAFGRMAGDLEQLMLLQPELRSFVDVNTLEQTQLTVVGRSSDPSAITGLVPLLQQTWERTAATRPELAQAKVEVVGESVLEAKVAEYLVPTLVQSFALTAALIFVTFLVVFRNGAARLMAMIPSLFAILMMFLVMRLTGLALNVATILIATTVLGTTENDQIHFFFHYQEGRQAGNTEEALQHTLRVAGRAIVFATAINAAGFLALAMSRLPPMRQFGQMTATAFLLSMVADFTALPAALWILFRARPEARPLN
jgi:uncharacterized protein